MAKQVRSFGPFQLERELGRGGNAVVFLATWPGQPGRYALKINTGARDREAQIRLQLEAQIAARLRHPGIVRVLDQGVHEGREYLLMEYCEGESLADRLDRGRMPWREAAGITRELARIMAVAHAEGVLHRDLKPANVMLEGPHGRPRIIDFGLARDPSLVRSLTQSQVILGTPSHMAPEQFVGGEVLDARTDVYALGVILYTCLTGDPPFWSEDFGELERLVCEVEAESPQTKVPEIPAALARVCLDALAKRPAHRPANATAFADALDAALGEAGLEPAGQAPPSGPPWGVAVAAVAALCAALVIGGALLRGPEESRPSAADVEAAAADRAAEVQRHLEAYLARAREFAKLGELLPYFDAAERAAQGDPELVNLVRLKRADAYRRRGDYQGCIDAAPTEVPGKIGYSARFLRGLCQLRLGRRLAADATFRSLVRDDPEGSRGLHARAVLEIFDGGEWGQYMQRARDADPDDVQAQLGAAYGLLDVEGPEAALAALAEIEEREPDEPHVHFERAFVLSGTADLEGALDAYAKVLEITDPYASHQALLGRARAMILQLERPVDGLRELDRLLAIDPGYPEALVYRGMALYQVGRQEEAHEVWRELARNRDPVSWPTLLERIPRQVADLLRRYAAE